MMPFQYALDSVRQPRPSSRPQGGAAKSADEGGRSSFPAKQFSASVGGIIASDAYPPSRICPSLTILWKLSSACPERRAEHLAFHPELGRRFQGLHASEQLSCRRF